MLNVLENESEGSVKSKDNIGISDIQVERDTITKTLTVAMQ